MKRWLKFIPLLLAASAFGHAPKCLLVTPLKNWHLATLDSSVSYTYDRLGQLSQALGSGGQSTEQLGFGYDGAWNLRQRTNGTSVTTFHVVGKNQLTTVPDGTCVYDFNRNLVSAKNGQQTFGYDDENRLIRVTQYASANVPSTQTAFAYDGLSRLRSRREYTWVATRLANGSVKRLGTTAARAAAGSGTWQLSSETRYVYDGLRVIQERNGNNVPLVSYTRGIDLSGSFEGAGGIGGLLGRSHGYNNGTGNWSTHNYYHADGAGNVTYLVNSSQTLAASYRYDPYGNLLASSGPLAAANVYRFSSKEVHLDSGLYSYGYRFYGPNWQRWLNQDPIGEWGGVNLYGFVGNGPISAIDPFGLESFLFPPQYAENPEFREGFQQGMEHAALAPLGLLHAAFELLDWASEASGLTGLLGRRPTELMEAIPAMASEYQMLRLVRPSTTCAAERTPITDPSRLLPAPRGLNPDLPGGPMAGVELPAGFRFNEAVSPGQSVPGAYGTLAKIPDVAFVRNDLAVIPQFKPVISGARVVEVTRPVRAQFSIVGPQVENGVLYPGGEWQLRILQYDPKNPFVQFASPENALH